MDQGKGESRLRGAEWFIQTQAGKVAALFTTVLMQQTIIP